jgi:hypothetical protein
MICSLPSGSCRGEVGGLVALVYRSDGPEICSGDMAVVLRNLLGFAGTVEWRGLVGLRGEGGGLVGFEEDMMVKMVVVGQGG